MGYFKIPVWLGDNLLSFEYPRKIALIALFEKPEETDFIAFTLVNTRQYPRTLKNNIYHSNKRLPPPFFHSDTNPVFRYVLIHSLKKNHVLVELIWLLLLNIFFFNFVPTPNKFMLGWQDSEEAM